ncbi:hypothetical protein JMG10_13430 [Nostoc ellipsosporum NOK]|nr:hypothetical protein [Nostoc ellipsosporum NOK]
MFFCLLLAGCCSCNDVVKSERHTPVKEVTPDRIGQNERLIDSLGLRLLYDEARWFVYALSFGDTAVGCASRDTVQKTYTVGEIEIGLDTIIFRNDTTDFRFYYQVPGKRCMNMFLKKSCYIVSVGMIANENHVAYYTTGCNFTVFIDRRIKTDMARRLLVLPDYAHRSEKMHPWFEAQAVKRGFLPLPDDYGRSVDDTTSIFY